MDFMEKLREGTLADAIDKFASRLKTRKNSFHHSFLFRRFACQTQQAAAAADGEEGWDPMALAPGQSLRDFLHDDHQLTPPPALPSPPPLRGAAVRLVLQPARDDVFSLPVVTEEVYGPQNRPQQQEQGLCDQRCKNFASLTPSRPPPLSSLFYSSWFSARCLWSTQHGKYMLHERRSSVHSQHSRNSSPLPQ